MTTPLALPVALATGVVAVLLVGLAAVVAWRRTGRVSVVDTCWGLLFVAVAWGVVLAGARTPRTLLLAGLVTGWGARLAWHIGRRSRGHGEDPRYAELLERVPPARRTAYALRAVFATQVAIAWFVALPLQVAATTDRPLGVVALGGSALVLAGLTFEAVGDRQLAAFRADPSTHGQVMDRGLWAWTRHPNYVGDAAVWWGLWVVAAEAFPGVLTALSPVVMTWILTRGTGARLLERRMAGRPGYADYVARTSGFLPRPPRRPAQGVTRSRRTE